MPKIDEKRRDELAKSGYRLSEARFGDKTASEDLADGGNTLAAREGDVPSMAQRNKEADQRAAESDAKAYMGPGSNKAASAPVYRTLSTAPSATKGDAKAGDEDAGDEAKPASKTAAKKAGK